MKRTPLKRTMRISTISIKKIDELNSQVPIRLALCQRAEGTPVFGKSTYYIKGKPYPLTTVQCYGGICECGCGEKTDGILEPHEKKHRSLGGKLSLDNTIMVTREHHRVLQNNEPIWTPKERVNDK